MAETASKIASAIIALSHENRKGITNLKLQKLLYYSQAWYLVLAEEPLFAESIEAWVHGPVVASVFGEYKHFRWSEINEDGTASSIPDIDGHLRAVWEAYGNFSASELERLTHQETPWLEARKGLAPDEPSRNIISLKTMREFYDSKLNG